MHARRFVSACTTNIFRGTSKSPRSFSAQLGKTPFAKEGSVLGGPVLGKVERRLKNSIYKVDLGVKFPSYIRMNTGELKVGSLERFTVRQLEFCLPVHGLEKPVNLFEGEIEAANTHSDDT